MNTDEIERLWATSFTFVILVVWLAWMILAVIAAAVAPQ